MTPEARAGGHCREYGAAGAVGGGLSVHAPGVNASGKRYGLRKTDTSQRWRHSKRHTGALSNGIRLPGPTAFRAAEAPTTFTLPDTLRRNRRGLKPRTRTLKQRKAGNDWNDIGRSGRAGGIRAGIMRRRRRCASRARAATADNTRRPARRAFNAYYTRRAAARSGSNFAERSLCQH